MRIAFYAPLKPADHPIPSGDRTVARLLIQALRAGGAAVEIASRIRSRIPETEIHESGEVVQNRMAAKGAAAARRLIAKYRARPRRERPRAWFTYHLYYKAADWIGPAVAEGLDIPYLLAEASHAPKRAEGRYAFSHDAVEAAIRKAAAVFCLNPADKACLAPLVARRKLVNLAPFLDLRRFAGKLPEREAARRRLARNRGIDRDQPWLLAVGMMREGDKLQSYRMLAEALCRLERPWQLLVVGDGPARRAVKWAFQPVAGGVFMLGALPRDALPGIYVAADLFVWPAINEAFGMALLEAQACGLPAVAGAWGGVSSIVAEGKTGWLSKPGDVAAFTADIDFALDTALPLAGGAARRKALAEHDIATASRTLISTIERVLK